MIDGGLGLDWQSSVETSSFTAVNGNGYFVNTTSGSITVTMPSSPIVGNSIGIIDYAGTTSTNKIILTSSNNIEGASNDKVVNYTRGALRITYADTTQGWVASAAANEGTSALNPNSFSVDFLVVAGGGGGGGTYHGGGGGAGGYRNSYSTESSGGGGSSESSLSLSASTSYTVNVGAGGNGGYSASGESSQGNTGSNSVFSTITSNGGGGGGAYTKQPLTGGSGGGSTRVESSNSTGTGAAGTSNQGYAGGNGGGSNPPYSAGGGGGGGSAGVNGGSAGGNGGSGLASSITGTSVTRAGGGGGSTFPSAYTPGTGGSGGGGDASHSTGSNGTPNTGSGGGGSERDGGFFSGGAGGSGTVILRYPTADVSSYAITGTLNTPSTVDTIADTAYPIANTAYYKLEGGSGTTVTDSSGNGYNGTASNLSPYAAGRFGQAAVFNGSSSKIVLPTSTFSPSTFTLSAWCNVTSDTDENTILELSDNQSYPNHTTIVFSAGSTGYSSRFLFRNYTTNQYNYNPSGSVTKGVWKHYAMTYDGSTVKSYIDGSLVDSASFTLSNPVGTISSIQLGLSSGTRYLNGSIDQVRIFNSALSASNVTLLANEHFQTKFTDGTDSILQFIGGTGTITFS